MSLVVKSLELDLKPSESNRFVQTGGNLHPSRQRFIPHVDGTNIEQRYHEKSKNRLQTTPSLTLSKSSKILYKSKLSSISLDDVLSRKPHLFDDSQETLLHSHGFDSYHTSTVSNLQASSEIPSELLQYTTDSDLESKSLSKFGRMTDYMFTLMGKHTKLRDLQHLDDSKTKDKNKENVEKETLPIKVKYSNLSSWEIRFKKPVLLQAFSRVMETIVFRETSLNRAISVTQQLEQHYWEYALTKLKSFRSRIPSDAQVMSEKQRQIHRLQSELSVAIVHLRSITLTVVESIVKLRKLNDKFTKSPYDLSIFWDDKNYLFKITSDVNKFRRFTVMHFWLGFDPNTFMLPPSYDHDPKVEWQKMKLKFEKWSKDHKTHLFALKQGRRIRSSLSFQPSMNQGPLALNAGQIKGKAFQKGLIASDDVTPSNHSLSDSHNSSSVSLRASISSQSDFQNTVEFQNGGKDDVVQQLERNSGSALITSTSDNSRIKEDKPATENGTVAINQSLLSTLLSSESRHAVDDIPVAESPVDMTSIGIMSNTVNSAKHMVAASADDTSRNLKSSSIITNESVDRTESMNSDNDGMPQVVHVEAIEKIEGAMPDRLETKDPSIDVEMTACGEIMDMKKNEDNSLKNDGDSVWSLDHANVDSQIDLTAYVQRAMSSNTITVADDTEIESYDGTNEIVNALRAVENFKDSLFSDQDMIGLKISSDGQDFDSRVEFNAEKHDSSISYHDDEKSTDPSDQNPNVPSVLENQEAHQKKSYISLTEWELLAAYCKRGQKTHECYDDFWADLEHNPIAVEAAICFEELFPSILIVPQVTHELRALCYKMDIIVQGEFQTYRDLEIQSQHNEQKGLELEQKMHYSKVLSHSYDESLVQKQYLKSRQLLHLASSSYELLTTHEPNPSDSSYEKVYEGEKIFEMTDVDFLESNVIGNSVESSAIPLKSSTSTNRNPYSFQSLVQNSDFVVKSSERLAVKPALLKSIKPDLSKILTKRAINRNSIEKLKHSNNLFVYNNINDYHDETSRWNHTKSLIYRYLEMSLICDENRLPMKIRIRQLAAVLIQSIIRGFLGRRRRKQLQTLKWQTEAAIRIQCMIRRFLALKFLRTLKQQFRLECLMLRKLVLIQSKSSRLIQRFAHRYWLAKQDKLERDQAEKLKLANETNREMKREIKTMRLRQKLKSPGLHRLGNSSRSTARRGGADSRIRTTRGLPDEQDSNNTETKTPLDNLHRRQSIRLEDQLQRHHVKHLFDGLKIDSIDEHKAEESSESSASTDSESEQKLEDLESIERESKHIQVIQHQFDNYMLSELHHIAEVEKKVLDPQQNDNLSKKKKSPVNLKLKMDTFRTSRLIPIRKHVDNNGNESARKFAALNNRTFMNDVMKPPPQSLIKSTCDAYISPAIKPKQLKLSKVRTLPELNSKRLSSLNESSLDGSMELSSMTSDLTSSKRERNSLRNILREKLQLEVSNL